MMGSPPVPAPENVAFFILLSSFLKRPIRPRTTSTAAPKADEAAEAADAAKVAGPPAPEMVAAWNPVGGSQLNH